MADGDDKTEAPTARRLQRARDEGNIPISRDLGTLVTLGALSIALTMMAPGLALRLAQSLSVFLSQTGEIDMSDHGVAALGAAGRAAAYAALPVILFVSAISVLGLALQTGFALHPARLIPDLARLDPQRGLRRVFGINNLVELGKSLVKILAAGLVCWHVLRADLPALQRVPSWEPITIMHRLDRQVLQVLFAVVGVQVVIGLGDFAWARYRHAQELRMSRFDIRQEQREADGDPKIKRRLRQIRAMRARRRMRDGVKRATVVVTNPTHYAVALRYDKAEKPAPVVVAKGADSMAARIREAAADFGVPLVANPPLARALYKLEIDAQVPPEHYRAVAEVIAFVWRLRQRRRSAA